MGIARHSLFGLVSSMGCVQLREWAKLWNHQVLKLTWLTGTTWCLMRQFPLRRPGRRQRREMIWQWVSWHLRWIQTSCWQNLNLQRQWNGPKWIACVLVEKLTDKYKPKDNLVIEDQQKKLMTLPLRKEEDHEELGDKIAALETTYGNPLDEKLKGLWRCDLWSDLETWKCR